MNHAPIYDTFPDEKLLALTTCSWYTDIADYLTIEQIPSHWTPQEKREFLVEIKIFIFDDLYLFKYCPDQIMRWCISDTKIPNILSFFHTKACGGHVSAKNTAANILQYDFYWPTLFKDSFEFCKTCDRCQQLGSVTDEI